MSRMIILGAGASRACPNTRRDMPLPLLADLPQILSPDRLNPKGDWPSFGKHFHVLLRSSKNDVEALLTMLYELDEYFFKPARHAILERGVIDRILASGALPEFFPNLDDCGPATQILEALRAFSQETDPIRIAFGPRNFLTVFRGVLRAYVQESVQSHPCPLHLKLFEMLNPHDCVVSFNYDEIADYALHCAGKLREQSFEGLGFTTINLPGDTTHLGVSVRFLKVHGSINWYNHYTSDMPNPAYEREGLRPCIQGGPEIHYYLDRQLLPDAGNTPDAFLSPFHCKDVICRSVPMFTRHMHAFRYCLADAQEIWLVGKNFKNSDRELNGVIRWATYGKERALHIIDPCIDVDFHRSLFNAKVGSRYQTLEEYARDA
jgi:hypothetical protein